MTTDTTTDLAALVAARQNLADALEQLRKSLWETDNAIVAALRGATKASIAGYEVEVERKVEYDREALRPLLEDDALPADKLYQAYIPEHQETRTVPGAWDMRKLKPLAAYSTTAAAIIEAAKRYGEPHIKVTAKGGKQ